MKAKKFNRKMRTKPILILVILGLVVAGLLYIIYYKGDSRSITAVADQFQPNASWQLRENIVTPPMPTCFGDVKCPSVHRSWNSDTPITNTEFQEKLQTAGWHFTIDGECNSLPLGGGSPSTMCTAKGRQGAYTIVVTLSGSTDAPNDRLITLSVE